MLKYVLSPEWFHGIDIVFEIFSLIVALLIARYGHKLYIISGNKKHRYFSIFFTLISAAFVFKILANFNIYYINTFSIKISNSMFYFTTTRGSEILFMIGYSIFKFLMMFSFFGLLYLVWDAEWSRFWINVYFMLIVTVFSHNAYYIFHMTMIILIIALISEYYSNYKTKGTKEAMLILLSFVLLLFSQITFMIIVINPITYVVGEFFQLAGFVTLLTHYITVTRYER